MVCEKRNTVQNTGRVARALGVSTHTHETCEASSQDSMYNKMGLSPKEQIDLEWQRNRALLITQRHMIR